MGSWIETDGAVMVVRINRIVFPAQAVIDRQLRINLPRVTHIERPGREAQRDGIVDLSYLARMRGEAEEELSPRIGRAADIDCRPRAIEKRGGRCGGRSLACGQRTVKAKRAPGRPESSSLRLKMVKRGLVVFEARADVCGPLI